MARVEQNYLPPGLTQEEIDQALAVARGGQPMPAPEPVAAPAEPSAPTLGAANNYGALEPGNIDLSRRPHVRNSDGSVSTVRSLGVNVGGKEVLIPTVSDEGRVMGDDEAIAEYKRTGHHLGKYASPDASTAAAEAIHGDQEANMPEDSLAGAGMSAHVGRSNLAPKQNIDAYRNERLDTQNERLANIPELGDEQGLRADDYEQMAAVHQRSAAQNKATTDEAKADVADSRLHEKDMRARADRIFSEMEQNKQPPPDSITAKVLGIIGSVAAIGGNGGAAQGLGMLGSMLGSDRARWAAERDANSTLYQLALKGADSDGSNQLQRLDAAQKVAALEAHEISDSLESIKSMGLGKHATALATEMQGKFKTQVLDELTQVEGEKQKLLAAQAAAAKKGQLNAQRDALWRMPVPVLERMRANSQLSELGHHVLAEKIATGQKEAANAGGLEKTEAETKKLRAEGGDGEGQEVLPGYRATIPLEKKDVSDIRTNAQILSKIEGNYQKLADIRARNKGSFRSWINKDDQREANNIISEMTGVMNQFAGRGAPSNAELTDMKEQLLDPTSTYWATDPEAVYTAQMKRLRSNFQAGLDAVGVQKVGGGRMDNSHGPQSRAAPSGDPRLRSGFVTPTAQQRGINKDAGGGIALPAHQELSQRELERLALANTGLTR